MLEHRLFRCGIFMTALLTVAPAVARLTVPSPAIETAAEVVAEPIVPASLITKSSAIVRSPAELKVILAVADAAVSH